MFLLLGTTMFLLLGTPLKARTLIHKGLDHPGPGLIVVWRHIFKGWCGHALALIYAGSCQQDDIGEMIFHARHPPYNELHILNIAVLTKNRASSILRP